MNDFVAQLLKSSLSAVLELVFPTHCVQCGKAGSLLCAECLASTCVKIDGAKCAFCGRSTTVEPAPCDGCESPIPYVDRLVAVFEMSGGIRRMIHALKYQDIRIAADVLGVMLASSKGARKLAYHADIILPMPSHPKRIRERGYNQAELLAKATAKRLEVPINSDILKRVKYRESQVTASSKQERAEFVRDAFECSSDIEGLCVILFDDVVTTGSSVSEVARCLKSSGASAVFVLAAARESLEELNA